MGKESDKKNKKRTGKDPAFLFYPNDYAGGTMGMSFEEKGAYMDLLIMQFNRGHMTSHMCGQVVGQMWGRIQDKFTQDADGLWYNRRLEDEILARKSYVESRKNNLEGRNQYSGKEKSERSYDHKMTSHMEDVDRDENENVISSIKKESENFAQDARSPAVIGKDTTGAMIAHPDALKINPTVNGGSEALTEFTENETRTAFAAWWLVMGQGERHRKQTCLHEFTRARIEHGLHPDEIVRAGADYVAFCGKVGQRLKAPLNWLQESYFLTDWKSKTASAKVPGKKADALMDQAAAILENDRAILRAEREKEFQEKFKKND